jgi:hypothetical protein
MAKEKQANAEAQDQELTAIEKNLRFYNQGREVPKDALKEIRAGRLKGMSDVNPMWRMKRMTEIFGPVGFGWKYTIDKQWEEVHGQEVKVFCNVSLYVRDPETKEWSDAIPGNGGSAVVSIERNGAYVNDEAYKMALTDALSIAMKPIGIGADIWYGANAKGHNESKYEQSTRTDDGAQPANAQPVNPTARIAYTGAQLEQALAEVQAITDINLIGEVWKKWVSAVPALSQNGNPFYKAICDKQAQLKQVSK